MNSTHRERTSRPTSGSWPRPRERWRGFGKPWRLLPLVLTVTAALCFTGCASTRKTASQSSETALTAETRDTTAAVIRQTRWAAVPESRVEMAVSVDSLLKLPDGAAYTRKSGQANIRVAAWGDTVYVTGTCDSLQREVEYYEALYHTARDALEQREARYKEERKERGSSAMTMVWTALIAGILAGITFTTIITRKRNRR